MDLNLKPWILILKPYILILETMGFFQEAMDFGNYEISQEPMAFI